MFARASLRTATALRFGAGRIAAPQQAPRRFMSSMYDTFYQGALKSNISYVTFVVAGAIVFEAIYGVGTGALWEYSNQGKLAHQIDWSTFKEADEEDEEEEE